MLVRLGRRSQLVEIAGALLLQLGHDALQLFLLLLQFFLVTGNRLLKLAERSGRILDLNERRQRCLSNAVVFYSHVLGKLMRCIQSQLGVAHIALATMSSVVTLNTQEVNLINQRLADAIIKHGVFHQLIEARLRQTRQQFFFVDGFGQFFGKAAQAGERAARIDVQHRFGKASQFGQQLVAGAKELEVN
ncbi:hypothetical protein D3C80_991030 [compost metagenome]